ncbi:hypothetical protein EVAR_70324_1 [Eumeta japonica]|uniref:Uncharacterized protein n=1 Tax=Eumeta variegata TaxID=151549 RepID=A0A4C2A457_EUMVA|nr:hypothetical protein EVAR_70324_1 [Eumeta japonica]
MISGCRTPSFMSGPFLVEEFHRSRKPAPLTNLLVHGQSVYDKRLPHPKFHVWAVLSRRVPPFSETSTAHQSARARSVAPLTNLLVHGQSVYDKRLPHPKFHVWAVLSRRVPPFSETSTAHQSARARRFMISGCRTPSFMSGPFLVEEFHRSRKPAPLTNLLVHGQSVYDKRLPHQVSCLGRSKSKSSTVLGNQHRSPICSCTVSRFMISGCRTQVSCLGRSKSKSSTVLGNQHRSPICSCTVSRFMISGCRTPSFMSGPFLVEEFHRSRKPAPLTNLLVHGQSVYDKRLPHPKFHVWAVLSRRVPPFSETSTAHQSARARRFMISGCRTQVSCLGRSKSKSSTVLGNQHRSPICSCTVTPLTNLLVHGQSVYDKRLPHPKFHVWAVLSRRVPPFSETSTAHQSARARSVAPLTNLLVHGQSVYDKRLPHPKFHVWAVLSRRVPPFSETSTAHQSARARSVGL